MRILITGGNSTLSTAVKPLLSKTMEVITAGRQGCDVQLDLLSDTEIKFPVSDYIIHTAAAFGGKTDEEILNAVKVNCAGTLRVCEAGKRAGVKHILLISSMFANIPLNDSRANIYSVTKKQSEEIAGFYCKANNIKLTVLRPSQIYGVGNTFKKHQPFLYNIIEKAQRGEDIILYGNNDPKRNYIYIDDVAQVIVRIVESGLTGAFNCCYPQNLTYSEIALTAYKVFNTKGVVKFDKSKADIEDNIFETDSALYNQIAFNPKVTITDGITKIASEKIIS